MYSSLFLPNFNSLHAYFSLIINLLHASEQTTMQNDYSYKNQEKAVLMTGEFYPNE